MRDMNFCSRSRSPYTVKCSNGHVFSDPSFKESYHIFRFCIISQMPPHIAQSQLVLGCWVYTTAK